MLAYLVMMAARLVELHRLLKPTGSLYLHCDPTASHYLKIILDLVFGHDTFRNEIVWHYKRWPAVQKNFQRMHDILLFYSKEYRQNNFNVLLEPLSPGTMKRWKGKKSLVEFDGKTRLVTKMTDEESPGRPMDDVWDIPVINSQAAERLGYPTQKPLALLERIIQASSNPGDLVLDPFCGCGTAIAAAEKLNRRWIGIDITYLAITLIEGRMRKMFPGLQFKVEGKPADLASARDLASRDRYQFQWWALSLVGAKPIGGDETGKGKKGKDQGIDGIINYIDSPKQELKRVIVQVKSGHVNAATIRDLRGVLQREATQLGVLITLEHPTKDMISEASTTGFYHSDFWQRSYPCLQMLTIEQLLTGHAVQMPPETGTFLAAQEVRRDQAKQGSLDL